MGSGIWVLRADRLTVLSLQIRPSYILHHAGESYEIESNHCRFWSMEAWRFTHQLWYMYFKPTACAKIMGIALSGPMHAAPCETFLPPRSYAVYVVL